MSRFRLLVKPNKACSSAYAQSLIFDYINDQCDFNKGLTKYGKNSPKATTLRYYSPSTLPFLWSLTVLKHFVSSIWNYVIIGLKQEEEKRWVVDGKCKRPKSIQDNFSGILSFKAKSVKNMEDKDPWVQALNGEAILPPPPMDEYFSTVRERERATVHSTILLLLPFFFSFHLYYLRE